MELKHKSLTGLKVIDDQKGEVEAVFAVLGVKDHDGDVTVKGAFTDGEQVKISAYEHALWKGEMPVGKGVIHEVGDNVILKGQFFMDTTAGRDTFNTVKAMGDLQEWSYGYKTLEEEHGTYEGKSANIIKKQQVFEVSPVNLGAGIGTHTTAVKAYTEGDSGQKQLQSELFEALRNVGKERWGQGTNYVYVDDFDVDNDWAVFCVSSNTGDTSRYVRMGYVRSSDGSVELVGDETEVERETQYVAVGNKGLKFSEHIKAVMADVDELTERTAEVVTMRAEKGKDLGEESHDLLTEVKSRMEALGELLTKSNNDDNESVDASSEVDTEWLRFVAQEHTNQGDN